MVSLSGQRYATATAEIILANLERTMQYLYSMLIVFWLQQRHQFWQTVARVSDQRNDILIDLRFSTSTTLRCLDWLWNSGS